MRYSYVFSLIRISLLTLILFFIPFMHPAHAQSSETAESNCIATEVGNPSTTPGECISGGGSGSPANNKLLKAAEDMKTAYDDCGKPSSFTGNLSGVAECLRSKLLSFTYPAKNTQAALDFRGLVGVPGNAPVQGILCSQCVGFADSSAALTEGVGWYAVGCAANMLILFPNGIPIGSAYYEKVGKGSSAKPLPGDIGIAGRGGCGGGLGYGHILIVKEVFGNVKFRAVESNWRNDCRVSNTVDHLFDTDSFGFNYTFYRKRTN